MKLLLPLILLLMLVMCATACTHDNSSAEALKKYEAQIAKVHSDIEQLEVKKQYENRLGKINANPR